MASLGGVVQRRSMGMSRSVMFRVRFMKSRKTGVSRFMVSRFMMRRFMMRRFMMRRFMVRRMSTVRGCVVKSSVLAVVRCRVRFFRNLFPSLLPPVLSLDLRRCSM